MSRSTCGNLPYETVQGVMCMLDLPNDWQALLEPEMDKPYFKELTEFFLENEYRSGQIFPGREHLFQALRLTSYEDTKP